MISRRVAGYEYTIKRGDPANSSIMRMRTVIRVSTPADISSILHLEQHSFEGRFQESAEVFLRRIAIFPQGCVLLIDADNKRPMGYMCTEIWARRETIPDDLLMPGHDITIAHTHCGSELYISSVAIHPMYRGQGFGRQLLLEGLFRIRARYTRIRSAALMVNERWSSARALYASIGFREIGWRTHVFHPVDGLPQAAVVMRKELTCKRRTNR